MADESGHVANVAAVSVDAGGPSDVAALGPAPANSDRVLCNGSGRSLNDATISPSGNSGKNIAQLLSEQVESVLVPITIGAQDAVQGAARLANDAQTQLQNTDAQIRMSVQQEAAQKRWSAFIRPTVWFRHPVARISIAFSVLVQDFFIYGEDPVNDSHVRANFPFMGHIMGLLTLHAAPSFGLGFLRVFLVIIFGILGFIAGRIFLIKVVRGKLKIIAMMGCEGAILIQSLFIGIMLFMACMFYSTVTSDSLDGASMEVLLLLGAENLTFRHVNKCFQCLSGSVDVLAILMITDVVLQDKGEHAYWPNWAVKLKEQWIGWKGRVRIIAFWVIFLASAITIRFFVFATGKSEGSIRWTNTTLGGSSEVMRSFLAALIVFTDLFTVVQDWEFPAFREPLDVDMPAVADQIVLNAPTVAVPQVVQNVPNIVTQNVPKIVTQNVPKIAGTAWTTLQCDFIGMVIRSARKRMPSIKVPSSRRVSRFAARLREWLPDSSFFKLSINGKWLTYGPLIGVMGIDLMCARTQLNYLPVNYGQYADPVDGRIWVITDEEYLEEAYERGYIRPGKEEMISYAARRNMTTAEALSTSAEADVKLNSKFIEYGITKWFGLYAAFLVILTFCIVYGVAEYQKHLQDAEITERASTIPSEMNLGSVSTMTPLVVDPGAPADGSENRGPVSMVKVTPPRKPDEFLDKGAAEVPQAMAVPGSPEHGAAATSGPASQQAKEEPASQSATGEQADAEAARAIGKPTA